MKRKLIRTSSTTYHFAPDGTQVAGPPDKVRGNLANVRGDLTGVEGNLTNVRGDLTGVEGNLSGVRGDLTGVEGDLSDISGDLDECGLTASDRKKGVHVRDLLSE